MTAYITIEIGLLEDDADVETLANNIVADIKDKYKYLDVTMIELD